MDWIKEILALLLLGIVQGVSEFLPISSTVHLGLVSRMLGEDIGIFATNILSLGTTLALIQYFWKDILGLMRAKQWYKHMLELSLATLPIVIGYLLIKDYVDRIFREPVYFGIFLISGGLLLLVAEHIFRTRSHSIKNHRDAQYSYQDYLVMGCFQALALLPGMSRSGSTLSGGLLVGKDRIQTIRTSFWISVPAFVLAGLYSIYTLLQQEISPTLVPSTYSLSSPSWISIGLGTFLSYVSGLYALQWLIPFLSRYSSAVFAVYRIILGFILVVLYGFSLVEYEVIFLFLTGVQKFFILCTSVNSDN
jgi:undecaprenyl-diphosphatase